MSPINKMLQDLDARAAKPGAEPLPGDVRPVPAPSHRVPWKLALRTGGAAVVVSLLVSGYFGYRMLERRALLPAPAQQGAIVTPAPSVVTPAAVVEPTPPAVVDVVSVAPPAPVIEPEPAPALEPEQPAPARPARQEAPRAERPRAVVAVKPVRKTEPVANAAPAQGAAPKVAPGRTETAAQQAENAYRRALGALEDGRVTEAIATLQAGLRANPKHEAARQTLVSLLIEAKRPEEAMRQLQAALTLDPRQPALAMLLARLQLERGGAALATLHRSLPYAAGNAEYHAFMAGVLQREGRQREAAEHYGRALTTAPQNGVWWMGLGMSLQAEKRDAEAVDAFERARASGALTSELQAFVERRLKQLGR
jgi:MSHA biogenesis protein MshN